MQRVLNKLLLAGLLGGLLFSAGCQRTCALAGGVAAQCLAGDSRGGNAIRGTNPGDREVAIVSAGGGINP
jgi:hypothetical protein